MPPQLGIFLKAPVAGAVKSRLARDIGALAAARVYRGLTWRTLRAVAFDLRWQSTLCVTPPGSVGESFGNLWPRTLPRIAQRGTHLGQRMAQAFRHLGPGPAILIGSDAPEIEARDIAQAFRSLQSADAVFGPARDGGYWLIGFANTRHAKALLSPIRWSSRFALGDTLGALGPALKVVFLRHLADIDTVEDLQRWQRQHRR